MSPLSYVLSRLEIKYNMQWICLIKCVAIKEFQFIRINPHYVVVATVLNLLTNLQNGLWQKNGE